MSTDVLTDKELFSIRPFENRSPQSVRVATRKALKPTIPQVPKSTTFRLFRVRNISHATIRRVADQCGVWAFCRGGLVFSPRGFSGTAPKPITPGCHTLWPDLGAP